MGDSIHIKKGKQERVISFLSSTRQQRLIIFLADLSVIDQNRTPLSNEKSSSESTWHTGDLIMVKNRLSRVTVLGP